MPGFAMERQLTLNPFANSIETQAGSASVDLVRDGPIGRVVRVVHPLENRNVASVRRFTGPKETHNLRFSGFATPFRSKPVDRVFGHPSPFLFQLESR